MKNSILSRLRILPLLAILSLFTFSISKSKAKVRNTEDESKVFSTLLYHNGQATIDYACHDPLISFVDNSVTELNTGVILYYNRSLTIPLDILTHVKSVSGSTAGITFEINSSGQVGSPVTPVCP